MKNSSKWFQLDKWLDVNMIETFKHRDSIYAIVRQDYKLVDSVKPTIIGEPAYEGEYEPHRISRGIHMRRQAYQSFFAGAAGFTYGAFRDKDGNGPLFSPFTGWEKMLDSEGSNSMKIMKKFCLEHDWPNWISIDDVVIQNLGEVNIEHAQEKEAVFLAPRVEKPETLHVILQVTDTGTPALTRYQRLIITVFPN